jgi:hypothetical protein
MLTGRGRGADGTRTFVRSGSHADRERFASDASLFFPHGARTRNCQAPAWQSLRLLSPLLIHAISYPYCDFDVAATP